MAFEGIVSVLKPPGMTSSDVVVDVRKIFGEKRVGHTGTLDPAAAGVLPICIGRATRLFDYLVDKEKEYIAEIRFGIATDTEDAYGTIVESKHCNISSEALKNVLPKFLGEIDQVPPIYSSLSVNGVKMYKLARRGEVTAPIEERKRRITIHSLDFVERLGENSFLIKVRCSKGTYIRTLCYDIGRMLGVPAYMPFLLRTVSGRFNLENSLTINELFEMKEQGLLDTAVVPMDEAVEHIPELRLDGLSARKRRLLINGASIPYEEAWSCGVIEEKTIHRLYLDGEFMGLCIMEEKELHITVWLGNREHISSM